jgi:hypothetical protein
MPLSNKTKGLLPLSGDIVLPPSMSEYSTSQTLSIAIFVCLTFHDLREYSDFLKDLTADPQAFSGTGQG